VCEAIAEEVPIMPHENEAAAREAAEAVRTSSRIPEAEHA
jgi:hypothetical protein